MMSQFDAKTGSYSGHDPKERVTNLYDLMNAAYDAEIIREYSVQQGHLPLFFGQSKIVVKLKLDNEVQTVDCVIL